MHGARRVCLLAACSPRTLYLVVNYERLDMLMWCHLFSADASYPTSTGRDILIVHIHHHMHVPVRRLCYRDLSDHPLELSLASSLLMLFPLYECTMAIKHMAHLHVLNNKKMSPIAMHDNNVSYLRGLLYLQNNNVLLR